MEHGYGERTGKYMNTAAEDIQSIFKVNCSTPAVSEMLKCQIVLHDII